MDAFIHRSQDRGHVNIGWLESKHSFSFGSWYKTHHFQEPRSFEAVNPNLKVPKVLESLFPVLS